MATSSPPHSGPPDDEQTDHRSTPLDRLANDPPSETLRAFAFWVAIVLPFLHVPLLATGLASPGRRNAFLVLLALNALALYVGHPYGRD